MKLKSVTIADFKRFHNLSITSLPHTARLVVLAGPNGRGKSSVLDAFRVWLGVWGNKNWSKDEVYYNRSLDALQPVDQRVQIAFHSEVSLHSPEAKRAFYFRSAHRNSPDIQGSVQRMQKAVDEVRFTRMTESDSAVSGNYSRFVSQAFEIGFSKSHDFSSIGNWRDSVIKDLSYSIQRLFPDLELQSLGNPLIDPTFRFKKGVVTDFDFKNLSAGEKAVFDLILDLCAKRAEFDDAIYCFDEPEVHVNPRLHGLLLDVLVDLIPSGGQMVIATHSIGMLRRARDMNAETPGHTVFLDFDGHDFDRAVVIQPRTPNRAFWEQAFEVALGDMASLLAPRLLIVCEGNPTRNQLTSEFDAKCYNRIFEDEFPDVKFVSGGNASDVESDRLGFASAFASVISGTEVLKLVDRDDRNDLECEQLLRRGVIVLKNRNIEAFLWSNDVLGRFCVSRDRADFLTELPALISHSMAESVSRDNPPDDIKTAAGRIYLGIKRALGLTASGQTNQAFAVQHLVTFITPGTETYNLMRSEIMEPALRLVSQRPTVNRP